MSTQVLSAHSAPSFQPVISTFDPSFDPSLLSYSTERPIGSRYEVVPHDGPGTAVYVRQPTRAQLVSLLSVFAESLVHLD